MATKITKTTGNRSLDEDVRRLYTLATQAQTDIAALKAPPKTVSIPSPPISPLPAIAPSRTVNPVEASSVVGVSSSYAAGDHAHEGLHSVAAHGDAQITGDAIIEAGFGITLSQTSQTITISATGGGGSTPHDAGDTGAALTIDFATNGINQYCNANAVAVAITLSGGVAGQSYFLEVDCGFSTYVLSFTNLQFGSVSSSNAIGIGQADLFEIYYNGSSFVAVAHNSGYTP